MNKAKPNYLAENINLLTSLTWKELETIYYLRVPSLKDYSQGLADIPETPPLSSTIIDTSKKPTIEKPETSAGEAIQKYIKDHISSSPFAKLKSNIAPSRQETAPSFSQKPLVKKEAQPAQPRKQSNVLSAWFVEPAQKPSVNQSGAEIKSAPSEKSQEINLDTAVEDAFGRMLKATKKKLTATDSKSVPIVDDKPSALTSKTVPIFDTEAVSMSVPIVNAKPAVEAKPPIVEAQPPIIEAQPPVVEPRSPEVEAQPPIIDPKLAPPEIPLTEPKLLPYSGSITKPDTQAPSDLSAIIKPESSGIQTPEEIAAEMSVPETVSSQNKVDEAAVNDTYVSRDVLRDLIQNHIKHAAGQGADAGQGQSIGTGKEYEVWLNNPGRNKFIGSSKTNEPANPTKNQSGGFKPRIVPADIRKSCLILGLRPELLSYETVQEAWKKSIALPGVHPDQGGDTEMAVYLNTAKDTLIRWLDAQAPKLGKKFGSQKKE